MCARQRARFIHSRAETAPPRVEAQGRTTAPCTHSRLYRRYGGRRACARHRAGAALRAARERTGGLRRDRGLQRRNARARRTELCVEPRALPAAAPHSAARRARQRRRRRETGPTGKGERGGEGVLCSHIHCLRFLGRSLPWHEERGVLRQAGA